jgi:hypothetical protein
MVLGADGALTFPTLTVPISDNATPSGTGQTIKFSDSSQQAIIFGPASTAGATSAQRVIIQGAPGYTGTAGEGGDVYLWAGPGGSVNGGGGDIKVRAGQGNGTGNGGYLKFQAGNSATGGGGYINIESGESGTYGSGGDITLRANSGGEVYLRTYTSGGTNNDWLFGTDGGLTFPDLTVQTTAWTNTGTTSTFVISTTTPSTSTTTGALTVTGGVGIGGNLYVGGAVQGTFTFANSGTTSAYATKRVLQYNETTKEITYSNTLDAVRPYITGYSSEVHVSPVAADDTGQGTIGDPVNAGFN